MKDTTENNSHRTFLGISKPSQAIEAMVKGIHNAMKMDGFIVSMMSFGRYEKAYNMDTEDVEYVCVGCAATCALMELHGQRFDESNIGTHVSRSEFLGVSIGDLVEFEDAIDALRRGIIDPLLSFFGAPLELDQKIYKEFGTIPFVHHRVPESLAFLLYVALFLEGEGY